MCSFFNVFFAQDKDVKEIREEYDDKKEKQWRGEMLQININL